MSWYLQVLKQYATFKGRARRKEYWMFFLVNFIVKSFLTYIDTKFSIVINIGTRLNVYNELLNYGFTDEMMQIGALSLFYSLFIIIPSLAVQVRRLHDCNRSGFWIFISLIPIIGAIILIIFFVEDSQPGDNRFGHNPKEPKKDNDNSDYDEMNS